MFRVVGAAAARDEAALPASAEELAAEVERLHARLAESEARYRLLQAATFEGITVHEHGRHIAVNDAFAAMLGYEPHEIDRLTAWDLAAPESRPVIQEHIRSGSDEPYEVVGIRKDGSRIDLEVRGKTLMDGERRLRVTALRDITDRKQAERALHALVASEQAARLTAEAAVASRDQFLSIASHELRTPVTMIKGNAQLLQRAQERGRLDTTRLDRSLGAIVLGADRLDALVQDLLDVSRLRTGRLSLKPQLTNLAALVQDVVARHGEHLSDRHRMVVEQTEDQDAAGDAGSPIVEADAGRIEQVLVNLLSNAVKYSPEGDEVRVRVTPEGDGVRVAMTDQGIGLPPGEAERIFEPFGRAENATNLPGMGLGLYISRQIVTQHGGQMGAGSAGPGQGTTAWFWLPRVAASSAAQ